MYNFNVITIVVFTSEIKIPVLQLRQTPLINYILQHKCFYILCDILQIATVIFVKGNNQFFFDGAKISGKYCPCAPDFWTHLLNPKISGLWHSVEKDYYCAKYQVIPIRSFRFIVLTYPHTYTPTYIVTKWSQYRRRRTTSSVPITSDVTILLLVTVWGPNKWTMTEYTLSRCAVLDRTYSARRFSIFSLIFSFYFGSCGRLSWLNCQLSSAR